MCLRAAHHQTVLTANAMLMLRMRASLSEASSSAAAAAQQALVEDDVPDSQVKVREVSSVKTMATACRFVSRGNLVMFFTLLISVTCV